MRKTITVAALLASLSAAVAAEAATLQIGAQYSLPTGFTAQWSDGMSTGFCGAPTQGGSNCMLIPPALHIAECVGTQTIKIAGVELLVRVLSGTTASKLTLWQGHHMSDGVRTVQVHTPVLPADAPKTQGDGINSVWVEFQASNLG